MEKIIEIWADSFHEGNWCCDSIMTVALEHGLQACKTFIRGFIPKYTISNENDSIVLVVYGSYKSWSPIPEPIEDLIAWGKPDFLAFDPTEQKILFSVEETAATPTGNQATQRCERQYGSARSHIPYWYLLSEFGIHRDGGVRRDSIWPTIAAIKLSISRQSPCIVLHYSDIDNPENYNVGNGVNMLFESLFHILNNILYGRPIYQGLADVLRPQYNEMLQFVSSQWQNIIDFLPSEDLIRQEQTPGILAEVATGDSHRCCHINGLLEWPMIPDVPVETRRRWRAKPLIKFDPLCALLEGDITNGNCYYLSDNAGSGKPPTREKVTEWIEQQRNRFSNENVNPPALFTMRTEDFPDTGHENGRVHLTTAKNIVYLYDSWNAFLNTLTTAYPRLAAHMHSLTVDRPVFVYVSNSLKPGRLFGDPFTGQIAAYSNAFGKFDSMQRIVVMYFPHQVHTQVLTEDQNKGKTLMTELVDYIIFNAGIAIKMDTMEVL